MMNGIPQPQSALQNNVKEFIGSVSPKGMVTIPQEARDLFNIKPKGKVVIRVSQQIIEVKPMPMTLEQTFGSVTPLNRPENFNELIRMAKEERAQKVI